jgi:class 3 adenylate cyclase
MIAYFVIGGAGFSVALVLTLIILYLRKERDMLRRRADRSAQELERLQRSFSRFAPAELVERIIGAGTLGSGERREVTVMFADIRDFTRISERQDPAVVIEVLNGYFSEMSRIIRSHHGHVTRIMGDGIMSVFGALAQNPWHALDAVEAAVDMKQALDDYNEALRTRGFPELRFGIGIHCGTVVAGVVGSQELLEFTVMGDVVNVASRIEGLTRQFDADILITNEVRDRIGDRFTLMEMHPAHLKGKTNAITTWALLGLAAGLKFTNEGRRY